jgi:hypothetical protein
LFDPSLRRNASSFFAPNELTISFCLSRFVSLVMFGFDITRAFTLKRDAKVARVSHDPQSLPSFKAFVFAFSSPLTLVH